MSSLFGTNPPMQQQILPSIQTQQPPSAVQQQSTQTLQEILQNATALTASVSGPELFGDDCDRVVSQLNQMLASVGVGQGYYLPNLPPFPYTTDNIFYRLKSVGYNRLSKHKNANGMVSLILASAPVNFATDQAQVKIVHVLNAIISQSKQALPMLCQSQQPNKPALHIELKSLLSHDEQNTEVVVIAKESGRIVPALDLYNELMQRANELRQQLHVEKIVPRIEIDPADLENYLRRPPPGFEEIWAQAIRENPDPNQLIPFPIQGFQQLFQRKKMQASLIASLHAEIDFKVDRLGGFQREILESKNKYAKIIQTQKELSNRLLQVLAVQAYGKRLGQAMDEKEEQLQSRLERINFLLNGPEKLKEQVTAVYDTLRRDSEKLKEAAKEKAQTGLNISLQDMTEIRRCLATRQQLVENLVSVVKQSAQVLKVVEHEKDRSGAKSIF